MLEGVQSVSDVGQLEGGWGIMGADETGFFPFVCFGGLIVDLPPLVTYARLEFRDFW